MNMRYEAPEMKLILTAMDAIMASVEEPVIPEEDLTDFNDANTEVLDKGWVNLF